MKIKAVKLSKILNFKLLIFLLTFSFISLLAPNKARAFSTFYPSVPSSFIPDSQRNVLTSCDSKVPLQSPGFVYWISLAGNPIATSTTVDEGTPSIQLQLNWSGAVCSTRSAVKQTHLQVVRTSSGAESAIGKDLTLNFYNTGNSAFGNYNVIGTYRNGSFQFTYAPPGGINNSNNGVGVFPKVINNFFSSPYFRCVGGGGTNGQVADFNDFSTCTEKTPAIPIEIIVTPKPSRATLINQKRLNSPNNPLASEGSAPGNSRVGISSNSLGREVFASTSNPYNQSIEIPTYGTGYTDYIDVPTGYKLADALAAKISKPGGVLVANKNINELGCIPITNGQRCYIRNLNLNIGDEVYVDWFLEELPKPTGLTCAAGSGTATGTLNEKQIYINFGTGNLIQNGSGTVPYSYNIPIPDAYFDGDPHSVTVTKLDGTAVSPNTFTSFGPVCAPPRYYPWLQTKDGDVVANNKIVGQAQGPTLLGSKPSGASESSYLVIASFGPDTAGNILGGPFCSTYKYILTNTNAGGGNCGNGAGYSFGNYPLGSTDNVVAGVEKAYGDIGAGCVSATLPTSAVAIDATCPKGKIYKATGATTLNGLNVAQGRATILVKGNLNITGPITYDSVSTNDPKDQPNLAIVVEGDVNISPSVGSIKSLIYATGKINTCSDTPQNCKTSPLAVTGSLVGKNGFSFNRTFTDRAYGKNGNPAEQVTLNPISILYPPPGISNEYFQGYNLGAQIDSTEYQPRF